jgi:putative transposase
MAAAEDDLLAYMSSLAERWSRIRSTNPPEHPHREFRRRADVVGVFPNGDATLWLVGILLLEQSHEWETGVYLTS